MNFTWKINRFRQRVHRSKIGRSIFAVIQYVLLGYYLNIYSASKLPLVPESVKQFADLWETAGYKGLLITSFLTVAIAIWIPVDFDPVIEAAEEKAAKKIPELMDDAKDVNEVLRDLENVKKSRNT